MASPPLAACNRGAAFTWELCSAARPGLGADAAQQLLWPCAIPRSHWVTRKVLRRCQGTPVVLAGEGAGPDLHPHAVGNHPSHPLQGEWKSTGASALGNPTYGWMWQSRGCEDRCGDRHGCGGTMHMKDTGCQDKESWHGCGSSHHCATLLPASSHREGSTRHPHGIACH